MEGLRWILLLLGVVLIAIVYWSGRRSAGEADESLVERARRAVAREGDSATEAHDGETARAEPLLDPEAFQASDDVARAEAADEVSERDEAVDQPAEPEAMAAASAEEDGSPATEPSRVAGDDEPAETGQSAVEQRPGPPPVEAHRMVVLFLVAAEGERLVGAQVAEALARHGLELGEQEIFHARDGDGASVFSVANAVEPGTFDPATMDTLSTPGLVLVLRLPGPQMAETAFDRMVATARALADDLDARVLDESRSTLTRQTEQHLREQLRAFDLRQSRASP
jgi:cell division protein ZipA